MIFCPKCGALLIPNKKADSKLSCSCGYSTKNKNVIVKEKNKIAEKIEVVDKTIETLPKTEMDCPKCEHNQAFYWLLQTRSSDEAETQFFRCTKCKHQWRSYQ
jgi:transcription factor S